MDSDAILAAIDAEIEALRRARALLSSANVEPAKAAKKSQGRTGTATRRAMSPEARKRIADAQRKRWAISKAQKKVSPAAVTPKSARKKSATKVKTSPARAKKATPAPRVKRKGAPAKKSAPVRVSKAQLAKPAPAAPEVQSSEVVPF